MVKENTVKQTEIGLLPEDWQVKRLIDVSELITKGTTPKEFFGSGVTFVKIESFLNDKINNNKCLSVSEFIHNNELKRSILRESDILFAIAGATIGKCAPVPKEILPANTNQALAIIRLEKDTDYKYVFYILKSNLMLNYIIDNAIGGAQPNLNLQQVGGFQIPLPPLPEQESIAEALSDTDAWIESLEQLIAKKRLIKQGAMQELFMPKEDWEVKKLGEVATISGGGTPSTFVSNYWNGDIEWFTPTEVGYDKYLYSSKRKISNAGLKNSSATILPINTILLTSRAGIGDLGILKIEACTNQGFQSIICNDTVDVEFIYYLMSTKREELLKNASGSTFLEISPNKVKSVELIIPSLTEQTRIATILSDMDAELEALEGQLGKARKVKQGMMQELLTGRVRLV